MKTPISYYGGKQTMLKYILPLIPEHTIYTEAFVGGAAVFFAKEPVKCEVINDTNSILIIFYRVLKSNYPDLKKLIDETLHYRESHTFAANIMQLPHYYTPIQQAWAVWALSKMSFASKLNGSFGYDFSDTMSQKINNAKMNFRQELCQRLEHATIENRDALKVISTYDKDNAFHFVDPPYINTNCGHYKDTFNESNMENLLQLLQKIRGKFMLTTFPLPIVEEYAGKNSWITHKIKRTICASKSNRRKQEEWIVCNYQKPCQYQKIDIK